MQNFRKTDRKEPLGRDVYGYVPACVRAWNGNSKMYIKVMGCA